MAAARRLGRIAGVLLLGPAFAVPAGATVPAGFQEYIVYGREDQQRRFLGAVYAAEGCAAPSNDYINVVTITPTADG